ncbi:hypothetical protein D8B26_000867 [Coccidioides posadasii str. Silveira]|uniref:uncharacterized protein n=1 Tax=Coccidioides posadasii (strain RMSCC 757 / Silveira) TaxID=443226 RepID=UPI001BF00320|nr:hypothetical protein D8B26_000867 [Coccidioides posadasii str. Silveira]
MLSTPTQPSVLGRPVSQPVNKNAVHTEDEDVDDESEDAVHAADKDTDNENEDRLLMIGHKSVKLLFFYNGILFLWP